MLTKSTCRLGRGKLKDELGRRDRGGKQCGAAREDFKASGRNRMCSDFLKGYQNTCIQFGCNPFISFVMQSIDSFENKVKRVDLGMALGLGTSLVRN